jgi:hypothetical protein
LLAYLRMQWNLSGRDGFRALSPSRRACEAGFGAFCGSEMLIFHYARDRDFAKLSWIETEANGGHWGDRTLNRMRSRNDRTHLVSDSSRLAWDTRASHRRVWSITGPAHPVKPQRNCETREVDRTRWRVWSRSTGRVRSCVGAY